jgi:hypothetical protein
MSISVEKPLAKKVSFDADSMWVDLADGRKLSVPLAYFPRLLNATKKQREKYILSGGGTGIHWDDLNEDIDVKYLLMGFKDTTNPATHTKTSSKKT